MESDARNIRSVALFAKYRKFKIEKKKKTNK